MADTGTIVTAGLFYPKIDERHCHAIAEIFVKDARLAHARNDKFLGHL
jgi:hypothetical protein